jgi:hypothetical protein
MTNASHTTIRAARSGPEGAHVFPYPHLLGIAGMHAWQIGFLLDEAERATSGMTCSAALPRAMFFLKIQPAPA